MCLFPAAAAASFLFARINEFSRLYFHLFSVFNSRCGRIFQISFVGRAPERLSTHEIHRVCVWCVHSGQKTENISVIYVDRRALNFIVFLFIPVQFTTSPSSFAINFGPNWSLWRRRNDRTGIGMKRSGKCLYLFNHLIVVDRTQSTLRQWSKLCFDLFDVKSMNEKIKIGVTPGIYA